MAGKGSRWPSELRSERDRTTGRVVHQITSHSSVNHPTYFLQSSFLPDKSAIIFTSYRTGAPQLFSAALPAGEIQQLTNGPPIHPFSAATHSSGKCVYFVRGGSIWNIDLASLTETLVIAFEEAMLGECSLSHDGLWLTAAIKQRGQSGVVTGRCDGTEWRLIPFPRTVIHPQFHPIDSERLIFAGDPAPRMFQVKRNGSELECLYEHGNDEFIVHETFLGRSDTLVYVVWPFRLCTLDIATRHMRTIKEINAWHIASDQAGKRVLCDTAHPDRGIGFVHVDSGEWEPICHSDSSNGGSQWTQSRYALPEDFARARSEAKSGGSLSWMETNMDTVYGPQWTHPHPSLSHDETAIAFASDKTGFAQVYVCELAS